MIALDEDGEECLGEVVVSVLSGDIRLNRVLVLNVVVVDIFERTLGKNSQSPTLQVFVLDKSLDLTFSQYAIQDRILVLSPSPQALLQDDHLPHEAYFGEPEGPEKSFAVVVVIIMIEEIPYCSIIFSLILGVTMLETGTILHGQFRI